MVHLIIRWRFLRRQVHKLHLIIKIVKLGTSGTGQTLLLHKGSRD